MQSSRLAEAAACVDDALESLRGSAAGWDNASDYTTASDVADPGVVLKAVVSLPSAFTAQYNAVQYKSFMGLFPEINRAWLTVDHRLFLWGYAPDDDVIRAGTGSTFGSGMRAGVLPSSFMSSAGAGNDFYSYEGLDQIIVSVGLVRPRPGVFIDEVRYLLAVATAVQVTLLGVTFSGPGTTGEISLIPTHISVATDNVLMLKIASTPDGRIFMAGADGSLHEFVYQGEQQKWMLGFLPSRPAKRARKVVHNTSTFAYYLIPASVKSYFSRGDELVDLSIDAERGALYTLSQAGSLAVYDVSDAKTVRFVKSIDVSHESRHLVSFSVPSGEREYVAIFAVPASLSTSVHLVAVTSFGERIYFSSASAQSSSSRPPVQNSATGSSLPSGHSGGARPKTLRCVGYRPSPDRDMSRASRPCVHIAWWCQGAVVFADLREKASDRLVCIFPDGHTFRSNAGTVRDARAGGVPKSTEIVFEISLGAEDEAQSTRQYQASAEHTPAFSPTRTFAIADVQLNRYDLERQGSPTPHDSPVDAPAFFWVLTSTAMHLYERVQPINRLGDILISGSGGADSEIRAFFARYGSAEACAMCLELAISQPALLSHAARVFYSYGGEPQLDRTNAVPDAQVLIGANGGSFDATRSGGLSATYSLGLSAPGRTGIQNLNTGGRSGARNAARTVGGSSFDIGRPSLQSAPLARFSGAHDGTSLYLAQILLPLWNRYITSSNDPDGYQCLAAPKQLLADVREQVLALVSFLDRYAPDAMLPAISGEDGKQKSQSGVMTPSASAGGIASILQRNGNGRRPGGVNDGDANYGDQVMLDRQIEPSSQDHLYRGLYQLKKTGEARRVEAASILALKDLGVRCAEGLALLMVLADHQLHRLVTDIHKDIRENLVRMRLCDLVAAEVGTVVSASLLEALFRTYSDGAGAVSTVGRILQERCPSYFGDDDIALHRGLALLRQARQALSVNMDDAGALESGYGYNVQTGFLDQGAGVASERVAALGLAEEAAGILKSVPERIFDLPAVCAEFRAIGAIPALIDVALTVGGVAEEAGDQGRAAASYDCVLDALGPLVHGSQGLVRPESSGESGAGVFEQNDRLKDAAMRVATSATSDKFLNALYEFLLRTKRGEEDLLQHASPGVEKFLETKKDRSLLWRFYAQHGRHLEAAAILLGLAEDKAEIALVDRLNHLSCALHNAKIAASTGDARAASLLTEVSDYMDVAKVQLRVRDELLHKHDKTPAVEDALKDLSWSILDLSSLFNKYARPFELYEASLDIFRCGSYRDDAFVRSLWMKIVNREATVAQTPALLAQKVIALGRDFYPSDVAFPVAFIVDLLERHVYENLSIALWREATGWVSGTMHKIGAPLGEIVDAYRAMIERQIQSAGSDGLQVSWADEGAQLHLMRATERALAAWSEEAAGMMGPGMTYDHGRRTMLSESEKALRCLSLCKSRLRAMSSQASVALVQRFEALERSISPLTR